MKYLTYISSKEKLNEMKLLCILNELDMENEVLKKDLKIIHTVVKNSLIRIEAADDYKVNELQANMILKGFTSYPQGTIITLYKSVLTYMFHIKDDYTQKDILHIIANLRNSTSEEDVEKVIEDSCLKIKAIRK